MNEERASFSIPVVCFVGVSGSGKTTLMEGVIAELTSRGWRVGTAKHHHKPDFEIDVAGKDSWRHAQAGAVVSIISAENKLGIVRKVEAEVPLEGLIRAADGSIDILLTESIRNPAAAQIEVVRSARSDRITSRQEDLFALVTDGTCDLRDVPVFGLDQVADVVDLIESALLGDGRAARVFAGAADPDKESGGSGRA